MLCLYKILKIAVGCGLRCLTPKGNRDCLGRQCNHMQSSCPGSESDLAGQAGSTGSLSVSTLFSVRLRTRSAWEKPCALGCAASNHAHYSSGLSTSGFLPGNEVLCSNGGPSFCQILSEPAAHSWLLSTFWVGLSHLAKQE